MSLAVNKLILSLNKLRIVENLQKCVSFHGSFISSRPWSSTVMSLQHTMLETQKMVKTSDREDYEKRNKEIISKVNQQLEQHKEGRLFAVVHICGKQFKVTTEDVILIEGSWAPQLGDQIKLEKVLLAGCSDFTLVGRPTLSTELVSVHATVVEKALSHIKTVFKKKRRKQYQRINFVRTPLTMLRINSITIRPEVNVKKDVEGIEGKIF